MGTQLPPRKGAQQPPPTFRPMSIMAKLSPISAALQLYFKISIIANIALIRPIVKTSVVYTSQIQNVPSQNAPPWSKRPESNRPHIKTRWLYCVECPQYSTRRRSASNIHRSSMLRKNS